MNSQDFDAAMVKMENEIHEEVKTIEFFFNFEI